MIDDIIKIGAEKGFSLDEIRHAVDNMMSDQRDGDEFLLEPLTYLKASQSIAPLASSCNFDGTRKRIY